MTSPPAQPSDEPYRSLFDDPELEAVFARSSPADTVAAVLTEARMVLADIDGPLDAELWGSDILAALGSGGQADALVSAAARSARRPSVPRPPPRPAGWPGRGSASRAGPRRSARRHPGSAGVTATRAASRRR